MLKERSHLSTVFQEIDKQLNESKIEKWIYNDYYRLIESLSKRDQHFFECIKYLISKGRVQILPVISKGLVHYKEAIYEDFGKSEFETYVTELSLVYHEINNLIKNFGHLDSNA